VTCLRIDNPREVANTISAALTMAFQNEMPIAVLLGQRLLGAKKF
jgi:hypothetical protein